MLCTSCIISNIHRMKRVLLFSVLIFILINVLYSQKLPKTSENINSKDIQKHITYLASDKLQGRKPGTVEDSLSAIYILANFKKSGLIPLYSSGIQDFPVITGKTVDPSSFIIVGNKKVSVSNQFFPLLISSDTSITGKYVSVDYGITYQSDSLTIDNYKNIDVTGKIVIIARGYPEYGKKEWLAEYADERTKVLTAKDKGAIGVIFYTPDFIENGKAPVEDSYGSVHFPVVWMNQKLLSNTFAMNDLLIGSKEATIHTQLITNELRTRNIVVSIEGTDSKLKDEYIVIGAHYDHLGFGGPGSGSRKPDTLAIHNGADDNASGVSGILELAQKFAKNKPKRSIIFVAFGAEEMGLLGSKYFVQHPPVDISKIKTMINLDMIGRFDNELQNLLIGGTGTSTEADTILNSNNHYGFRLKFSPDGFGASDHSSFYSKSIPVFFVNSVAHDDYHTPDDDVNRINFKGEELILKYIYDIATEIANRAKPLTFKESGEKEKTGGRTKLKVTLGIIPDFASQESKGLRVDGVRKGGPASKAGILKGDIITALDGKPVTNIQDYMSRLKVLKPGQIINIDLLRDNKKIVLIVNL